MKRNVDDLPAVIKLGRSFSATRFLVTNVLPYTREMCDEILYRDVLNGFAFQPSPYLTEIPKLDLGKITTGPFVQALYGGNTMSFAGASLAESADCCPFIAKRATAVRWDGELVPCLPLLHDHTSYWNGRERFPGTIRSETSATARLRICGAARTMSLSGRRSIISISRLARGVAGAIFRRRTRRIVSRMTSPPAAAVYGRRGSSSVREWLAVSCPSERQNWYFESRSGS